MTEQKPIGSGFGAQTTASEVLVGEDLTGRLAVVTGGYSGLGLETTRTLVAAGAEVIVPARRPEVAAQALAGSDRVTTMPLDLGDLDSVRAFVHHIVEQGRPIHILINNAGIMACPESRVGPGWEAQFATNHLGHFVLAAGLWPMLVKAGGARVIAVSSGAHKITGIRWDDPQFTTGYERWQAYGQSKTANILFAVHLDAIGREHGVRAFSLHPGAILTPLQRHLSKEDMIGSDWIDEDGNLADPSFKTIEQGAATAVWAATSRQLDGLGGVYCLDCDVAPVDRDGKSSGVRDYAIDPDSAARLWRLSSELTGDGIA